MPQSERGRFREVSKCTSALYAFISTREMHLAYSFGDVVDACTVGREDNGVREGHGGECKFHPRGTLLVCGTVNVEVGGEFPSPSFYCREHKWVMVRRGVHRFC